MVSDAPPQGVKLRIGMYRALAALIFLGLTAQLWRLQILQGDQYQTAADVNRFRLEVDPAPRGIVYDRRGHQLVRNMPQITVSVIPAYLPEDQAERKDLLIKVAELLEIPAFTRPTSSPAYPAPEQDGRPIVGLLDLVQEAGLAPYRPALIKTGVSREVALLLEEEHLDWPGILVQVEAVREYLHGPLTSHILGYVGPIPSGRVDEYRSKGYNPNRDKVGLAGVEYTFEEELRGFDGQRLIEVDVAGRKVNTASELQPAMPGDNLRLTLDLDLQRATEDILQAKLKALYRTQGVAIVMNPQTGEILAMVSLPSYDNNEFTGGISAKNLRALQEDFDRPLVNHAISGQFPPGSTFKIIPAAAALEEQVIDINTQLYCGGILWLPNRFYPEDPSLAQPFYCWIHHGYHGRHGSLNVISALTQSCDIFFYQVGGGYRDRFRGLGEERLGYYAELFGMGTQSGIDLPGETAGLVPTVKWKRINYSESWVTGDTYNMAMGQGFVLATPLQVLNSAAVIANGGILYRPQIVREVLDSEGNVVQAFTPDVVRRLPISQENINIVRRGMLGAVSGPGATARSIHVPGIAVAGKTGTAEFFIDRNKDGLPDRDRNGFLPTHAWFTAFAPYEDPEIAVVVFIFHGGEGSAAAVPVTNDILNYYFSRDTVTASEAVLRRE